MQMPYSLRNIVADHNTLLSEEQHARNRAQQLWGDSAWVINQTDLSQKMFIVSSGKQFKPRAYGEGKSWDEAFADAGVSLFAGTSR